MRLRGLVWIAAAAVGLIGCARSAELAPEGPCRALRWQGPARDASVVLIVNDAMRQDRVGIYGGSAATPRFDAFARENLWFSAAFTQAPWTKPSVATLFTSLYPSQHRMARNLELVRTPGARGEGALREADVLPEAFDTLAEVLAASGMRTAAFVSNPWLEKRFGFAQGFEVYDDSFARWDLRGEVVTEAALRWLEGLAAGERFFLYLHYLDSHRPWPALSLETILTHAGRIDSAAAELPPRTREMIRALVRLEGGGSAVDAGVPASLALLDLAYDKGVEQFDGTLARLLDGLREHPAWERMAVVVTSDHGEALFTRGYGNHGRGLHDDELAVPLAARLPGVQAGPGPVDCVVGLVDLMPTLCTYLGVECPGDTQGIGLLPGAGPDRRPARYLVSEGVGGRPRNRALRNRRYKLLWEPDGRPEPEAPAQVWSLYDVAADAREAHDVVGRASEDAGVARAFEVLSGALPHAVPEFEAPEASTVPVEDDTRERLRALGYLGEE